MCSERMMKDFDSLRKKLHMRKTAPPTCPTMAASKTALPGLLMCVKYHPWHKCYWQTWLDIWGSELPAYLMHIHLLYPTGLARAPKLCHLATLQLPPKCIVTLIMQICTPPPPPNTCIRSLLLYWGWDMGLAERDQVECLNNLLESYIFCIFTLQNSCHSKGDPMRNVLWCSDIHSKSWMQKGLKLK